LSNGTRITQNNAETFLQMKHHPVKSVVDLFIQKSLHLYSTYMPHMVGKRNAEIPTSQWNEYSFNPMHRNAQNFLRYSYVLVRAMETVRSQWMWPEYTNLFAFL